MHRGVRVRAGAAMNDLTRFETLIGGIVLVALVIIVAVAVYR
jgi:hypothetical protein